MFVCFIGVQREQIEVAIPVKKHSLLGYSFTSKNNNINNQLINKVDQNHRFEAKHTYERKQSETIIKAQQKIEVKYYDNSPLLQDKNTSFSPHKVNNIDNF